MLAWLVCVGVVGVVEVVEAAYAAHVRKVVEVDSSNDINTQCQARRQADLKDGNTPS